MIPKYRAPTHPGQILLHEFLEPAGMTQHTLAERTGMSLQRINTLVNGKRGMTAETAWELARVFDTSPEFWMQLQNAVDLHAAKMKHGNRAGRAFPRAPTR